MRIVKLHANTYFPEDIVERYSRMNRTVAANVGFDVGGF
jgi:transposase-like protein